VTTYPVLVSLQGSLQGLTPGMTANLTVITAQAQNVTVVPSEAVVTTSFGSFVTALDQHNNIVRVPVQVGMSDVTNTQIISGLTPGQRVIVPLTSGTAGGGGFGGGRGGGRGGFGGGGGGVFLRGG
jgi:multidrug efflux pump subunit AcrA (membrane-fusion protein)